MRTRQSNFELLRIISMCMIIAMHYMTKGMALPKLSVDLSISNCIYRLIFAFCTVSVNAYVLISGYFLCDSEWKIGKVLKLWLEVLFYSVMVPLVLGALGIIDFRMMDLGQWQQILLPIEYEHYWFASAYVMMYLLSPVLGIAVHKLDRIQLRNVILALLFVFCGFKSINPYLIPWDKYGCDLSWFICLYLVAGYVKLYGIKYFDSKKKGFTYYVLFSILTFLIALVMAIFVRATGKLEYYMDMTYCYNYVTVFIASLALFSAFIHMNNDPSWSERACRIINQLAGYTFGIYLLHENILLRELWPKWLGIDLAANKGWQILHMLLCIVIIFISGVIVDAVRTGIFRCFSNERKVR